MDESSIKNLINETVKNTIGEAIAEALKKEPAPTKEAQVAKQIAEEREIDHLQKLEIEKGKQDAVFVKTIYSDLDRDAVFLPEDVKKIADTCMRAGETDSYKTELTMKNITDRVFEFKDNLDALSDHSRVKIMEYLSLSDEAKLKRAREIWPLVGETVNVKKNLYAQEEKRKQKMGLVPSDKTNDKQTKRLQESRDVLLGVKKLSY